jgi:hypothetical protein
MRRVVKKRGGHDSKRCYLARVNAEGLPINAPECTTMKHLMEDKLQNPNHAWHASDHAFACWILPRRLHSHFPSQTDELKILDVQLGLFRLVVLNLRAR